MNSLIVYASPIHKTICHVAPAANIMTPDERRARASLAATSGSRVLLGLLCPQKIFGKAMQHKAWQDF
jgi:hypothetical protein